MFATIVLAGLSISSVLAGPVSKRDDTQPVGNNPITKFTVKFLGQQVADNSCSHRDLGFTGSISGKWYALYGDTLWCDKGVTDPSKDTPKFHGLVRDSVSALTSNPLKVHDLNLNNDSPVPHQNQFIPYVSGWGEDFATGFGGTSILETNATSGTGAIFYLVNINGTGIKGAGVARIQTSTGTPRVTSRLGTEGIFWPVKSSPRYGDQAAYRDVNSDYIYAWGGTPSSVTTYPENQYVYQVRVHASKVFDLAGYEYWHGRAGGWSSTPLTDFNSNTAVMWGVGQGQMVYSNFYKCYIYIHMGGNTLNLRTAPAPQGPWAKDVPIYTTTPIDNGEVYAGVAYPSLDTSGQTLTVAWTNNNHIEVAKISFSK